MDALLVDSKESTSVVRKAGQWAAKKDVLWVDEKVDAKVDYKAERWRRGQKGITG